MITLTNTLKAWKSESFGPEFTQQFKLEIAAIDHHSLPLQQGLSLSSYVSDDKVSAIINNTDETDTHIIIKSGIFYSGIIAGCSCSDDPTPLDTQNEYCEMFFTIDKLTAQTSVSLITE
ncbi:MAG: hypothetical protein DIZ80_17060 [endosymbiont of Galathealinum brachiosum]|uniref:Uncharacterized protein n=1 Tax=endosymbiont of Galathealinum brachiosum TaxID=2200906 RepID=A0A370D8X4_9GAMM|nr:MAG: hypothetical protein DIZ80_17060 [endosymbiont of Galathealinum brachiosum]